MASASAPAPVPFAIARSMLSFGIEASRAFCTEFASAALVSGSPPPSRAATVIARASLVKCAPRRASTIAFLCLIPAHFECPDTLLILRGAGNEVPAGDIRCRGGARPGDLQGLRHPRSLRVADRRRSRRAHRRSEERRVG